MQIAHRSSSLFSVRKGVAAFGITALLAVSAATAQMAGGGQVAGSTGIDASGDYQRERAACMSGRSQQDQATCLREAQNAEGERRRGRIAATGTGDQYSQNALRRCEPLSGEDKAACQARIAGYGSTSGSVAGGGLIRQVETVVVPPGATSVTIEPKTADPVLIVPK